MILISNVIFDLGNVLLSFKPEKFLLQFTEDQELISFFVQNIIRSRTWLKLDRGTISVETARHEFSEQFPENQHPIDSFFDEWTDILLPIEENIQILKDLKENGYNCYFLSNFIKHSLGIF